MKSILFCLLILAVLTQGCSTTGGGGGLDLGKTAQVLRLRAQLETYTAIQIDPTLRPYFGAAPQAISFLLQGEGYDPSLLRTTLAQLAPEAGGLYLQVSLGLYQIYFAEIVASHLNQSIYAKTLLEALRDGIQAGLDQAGTENRFDLPRSAPRR
jgi:hypothetical protein